MTFVNWLPVVLNPITALFMVYILVTLRRSFLIQTMYRVALMVSITGLVGQLFWSAYIIAYDQFPRLGTYPWWVGKDVGLFLLCVVYLIDVATGGRIGLGPAQAKAKAEADGAIEGTIEGAKEGAK